MPREMSPLLKAIDAVVSQVDAELPPPLLVQHVANFVRHVFHAVTDIVELS